jgi:hypothetical protein
VGAWVCASQASGEIRWSRGVFRSETAKALSADQFPNQRRPTHMARPQVMTQNTEFTKRLVKEYPLLKAFEGFKDITEAADAATVRCPTPSMPCLANFSPRRCARAPVVHVT